ncbi:Uncharacterized protein TPAR_05970 [Tolypocladium paradoxum]|uniref:Uncharacterized protein n=1 Tax=Tolypocladium paradoxum TaxID=94208 RepID=A0A2S4KUG2_9HYPO|nr:Uncharacterized protein TPAR_05970 [Tolypocladium paradoxum]
MTTSIPYTTDAKTLQTKVSELFDHPVEISDEEVGGGSIKPLSDDAVGVLVVNKSNAGAVRVVGGGSAMENVQTNLTEPASFTLLYINPGQTCWVLGQSSYHVLTKGP